jgi:hypothetical protein
MGRCSICRFPILPTDSVTECPQCDAEYHQVCWNGIGGCATYGCAAAAQSEKAVTVGAIKKGWGDEKTCPDCGQFIGASLLRCTSCKARFPWAEPMTKEEYRDWSEQQKGQASGRKLLFILFIVSLFGLPAPLTGPFAGFYAFRMRHALVGENGSYLALGYGTALIGLIYAVLFSAFASGL